MARIATQVTNTEIKMRTQQNLRDMKLESLKFELNSVKTK